MSQSLTAVEGKKVKSVNPRKKEIVFTNGITVKITEVKNTNLPAPVRKGAVAEIRRLAAKGWDRAKLIAKGFNANTVSTQLYKFNHS